MVIEAKKSKQRHEVSTDDWKLMQENGLSRNFTVLDATPALVEKVTKRADTPMEILDFIAKSKELQTSIEKPKKTKKKL